MDATINIAPEASSSPQRRKYRTSELYDTMYDGPTVKMIRECKFCTTPFWYFINNMKGSQLLMMILLMMCGPVGANLLFQIIFPYRQALSFRMTTTSGTAIWFVCYALGCTCAALLLFGEAMEILRYADAMFWLYYYRKKEEKAKQAKAKAELEAREAGLVDESAPAQGDAEPDESDAPFRLRGALIRYVFKFQTNNVMQDGEFPELTPCQWFLQATWMERFCHIFFSLRWLAASFVLMLVFVYNYTWFFMNITSNILMNDFYFCMLQFVNGMSHVTMVYMGWKIALVLFDLWSKSRPANLRSDFLRMFHPIPDGLRYIPDPKFAFLMDGCPCSYVAPEALSLPPAYEQSTHFHSYYAHIFKSIFCCVALLVVSVSAAHSLAAGIMYVISVSARQVETFAAVLDREEKNYQALLQFSSSFRGVSP